ncbi:hypothetical protein PoB_005993200 [Plakobranchus ocellatus]|uniref:Uncharacterized protein n=1 Tax=Plakobranchus ocellatus TaxID=259542 RepID=A0AAV4CNI7_9GAST|nr:hypothetical protein PoB_005993200 [Plakobranchus ocellatus]
MRVGMGFVYIASPQQGDLRLSGPPSGQGTGGGARTRDRRVPAYLRAGLLATVPPTPIVTTCIKICLPPLFVLCIKVLSRRIAQEEEEEEENDDDDDDDDDNDDRKKKSHNKNNNNNNNTNKNLNNQPLSPQGDQGSN